MCLFIYLFIDLFVYTFYWEFAFPTHSELLKTVTSISTCDRNLSLQNTYQI